eukprot:TRINITY_DN23099_c0_g1_i1.p1 TRINITY_DN23099_c0_g1~~TRINITY_DN23099_c0_g1_i1.p1  ORF type:complete len:220 (-),score=75.28 TRINITY_DN23099_c0_g1_i1:38-634(-)
MSSEMELEYDFEVPENPFEAFYFAVECILEEWHVLQVAVQNEWVVKAQEKKDILMNDILDLFESKGLKVNPVHLREYLGAVMLQDFSVDVQDGSLEHTANLLETVYRDIHEQRLDGWKLLMCRKEQRDAKKRNGDDIVERMNVVQTAVINDSDEDSDDDDGDDAEGDGEDVNMTQSSVKSSRRKNNEPDEDGWTTVRK